MMIGAVRIHDVNLTVPALAGLRGDLAPIGRKMRCFIVKLVVGEPGRIGAVGVHHIDLGGFTIPEGYKCDSGTIGGP